MLLYGELEFGIQVCNLVIPLMMLSPAEGFSTTDQLPRWNAVSDMPHTDNRSSFRMVHPGCG